MKTKLTRMTILAAATIALSATAAFAGDKTLVNIPFSFRAGGTEMPAGDYAVIRANHASAMLQISSLETHQSAFVLAKPAAQSTDPGMRISFRCVNDACSLSGVRVSADFAGGDARSQMTGREAVRVFRDQRPEGE